MGNKEQEDHNTESQIDLNSASRRRKMEAAGFEERPMEPGTSIIWFGPLDKADTLESLSSIKPGDPVEIRRNDPDNPQGVWQGGLVAVSGLITGSADRQYPGEPVVWVNWTPDYERAIANGQPIAGDEWPADSLRFDRHPELHEPESDT